MAPLRHVRRNSEQHLKRLISLRVVQRNRFQIGFNQTNVSKYETQNSSKGTSGSSGIQVWDVSKICHSGQKRTSTHQNRKREHVSNQSFSFMHGRSDGHCALTVRWHQKILQPNESIKGTASGQRYHKDG